MFKTYYYIRQYSYFLRNEITGSVITSVFSQEKNKVILELSRNYSSVRYIEFSVDKELAYLICKDDYKRAVRNSVDVLDKLLNKEILEVGCPELERAVSLRLSEGLELIFVLIPRKSNLHIITSGIITGSFKNSADYLDKPGSQLFERISGKRKKGNNTIRDYLKCKYNAFGEVIYNEVLFRTSIKLDDILLQTNQEIIDKSFSVITNEIENPRYFLYSKDDSVIASMIMLRHLQNYEIKEYKNIDLLSRAYISSTLFQKELGILKNLLITKTEREITSLSKKIESFKKQIVRDSEIETHKVAADYIMENLYNIPEYSDMIKIGDSSEKKVVYIKLNKELSLAENADIYYNKYKQAKKSLGILKHKLDTLLKELNLISAKKDFIENCFELKVLRNMEKENRKEDLSEQKKFRIFRLDENFEVWVGKNSASNDLLTTRFSSQNDIWFHVRGASGSHTVLKTGKRNDKIPAEFIKISASIAAYYSKARNAGNVPVAYTLKKYVKKKKGLSQGQVIMEREKVIFVKPGLPDKELIT